MISVAEFADDVAKLWSVIPTPLIAVAGGTAGTLFGAWLTSRAQHRREIVDQLRALRSLHAMSLVVANQCLAAKSQQIAPMLAAYRQAKRDFELYLAGPRAVPFPIQFEFHDLPQVNAPMAAVEKLAFEKCDLGPKGLSATAELRSATESLNRVITSRNELLSEFRASKMSGHDELFRYFGLRNPDTRTVDERYPSMVEALGLMANDGIFFARQLGQECVRHANARVKRFRWKYSGLPYKRLEDADWSRAINEGLIPPDADYINWSQGFREEVPTAWWRRKKRSPAKPEP